MCYACDMCNKCGRFDRMKGSLGKRVCYSCGEEVLNNDATVCPNCGSPLPPPFPEPLPQAPKANSTITELSHRARQQRAVIESGTNCRCVLRSVSAVLNLGFVRQKLIFVAVWIHRLPAPAVLTHPVKIVFCNPS